MIARRTSIVASLPWLFLAASCDASGPQASDRQVKPEYGEPNPNAPQELSQFAFLIGTWRCEVRVRGADGAYEAHEAEWIARYALDGYAIADEYRQTGPDGNLVKYGATYRSYNADRDTWVMKWLDALASTWLDLGPEDLGGVQVNDTAITFKHRYPPGQIVRVTISDISEEHFRWRADVSSDGGETWDESVMVIDSYRVRG